MPSDAVTHVIDDDEAVRHSIEFLLRAANIDVKVYDSAVAFLAALPAIKSGCVVTDVRMPEMDGLELQRRLAELHPQLPVIIITGHADVPLAVQAMKAGAVDFIEKPFSDEVILASIETALKRRRSGAPAGVSGPFAERLGRLTPRERDVFHQLIVGHPNKVIAYNLNISARTVEIHRARVMEKMQVRSLPELVRLAIEAGVEIPR